MLQGLTEEEKESHALRLSDAVEKMRHKAMKCGRSQVQAQAAAAHSKNLFGAAVRPTADLASHLLWSRKYQPSNLSEVIPQHAGLSVVGLQSPSIAMHSARPKPYVTGAVAKT